MLKVDSDFVNFPDRLFCMGYVEYQYTNTHDQNVDCIAFAWTTPGSILCLPFQLLMEMQLLILQKISGHFMQLGAVV